MAQTERRHRRSLFRRPVGYSSSQASRKPSTSIGFSFSHRETKAAASSRTADSRKNREVRPSSSARLSVLPSRSHLRRRNTLVAAFLPRSNSVAAPQLGSTKNRDSFLVNHSVGSAAASKAVSGSRRTDVPKATAEPGLRTVRATNVAEVTTEQRLRILRSETAKSPQRTHLKDSRALSSGAQSISDDTSGDSILELSYVAQRSRRRTTMSEAPCQASNVSSQENSTHSAVATSENLALARTSSGQKVHDELHTASTSEVCCKKMAAPGDDTDTDIDGMCFNLVGDGDEEVPAAPLVPAVYAWQATACPDSPVPRSAARPVPVLADSAALSTNIHSGASTMSRAESSQLLDTETPLVTLDAAGRNVCPREPSSTTLSSPPAATQPGTTTEPAQVPISGSASCGLSSRGPTWAAHDSRVATLEEEVRVMQQALADARQETQRLEELNSDYARRLSIAEEEARDAAQQLRDTRSRMGRRARELESSLEEEKARATADASRTAEIVRQLAAEVAMLRGGAAVAVTAATSSGATGSSRSCVWGGADSSAGQESKNGQDGAASEIAKKDTVEKQKPGEIVHLESVAFSPKQKALPVGRSVPRSATLAGGDIVSSESRRAAAASSLLQPTVRGVSDLCREFTGTIRTHRESSPSPDAVSCPTPAPSPRAQNRLEQTRQILLSHIHASKYRNMRVAWYDVFNPQGTKMSSERFRSAVRALNGISVDVRDRELDELRCDIAGLLPGEGGLTWAQFVRFYQRTRPDEAGRPSHVW